MKLIKLIFFLLKSFTKEVKQAQQIIFHKKILKRGFDIDVEDNQMNYVFASFIDGQKSDSSELIFESILQILDGSNILKINYTIQDIQFHKKISFIFQLFLQRLNFIILKTGFNDLEAIYLEYQQNDKELRRQVWKDYIAVRKLEEFNKNKSERTFEKEQTQMIDNNTGHLELIDRQIQKPSQEDKELKFNIIQYLEEAYHSKYENKIDDEIDQLQKQLKHQQFLKIQNLKNIQNDLEAKINKKRLDYPLYQNNSNILGSQIFCNSNKSEMIFNPKFGGNNYFNQPNHMKLQETVCNFQGINIYRKDINDFNLNGIVSPSIIEFFLNFLMLKETQIKQKQYKCTYLKLNTFPQLFQNQQSIFGKQIIIQNYDRVLFPIKSGFVHEHQLVLIDFKKLQIIHYHLCELPFVRLSYKQYIQQSWEMSEDLKLKDQRQLDQDKVLKATIHWIQKQTKLENIEDLGDLRLWKIRLATNVKVDQVRETGLFMLLLCALIVYEYPIYFNDNKILNFMKEMRIMIYKLINQQGIGQNQLNNQNIENFKKFMNDMIMELQQ